MTSGKVRYILRTSCAKFLTSFAENFLKNELIVFMLSLLKTRAMEKWMKQKLMTLLLLLFSISSFANQELLESLRVQMEKNHRPVTVYKEARKYVHGYLYLQKYDDSQEIYFITSFYCGIHIGGRTVGPGKYPDVKWMNTEQIWPQSKFDSRNKEEFVIQKSDLFNIVPVLPLANSNRGNKPFGIVRTRMNDGAPLAENCHTAVFNKTHVEPTSSSKGDIARAMFYFSTRYNKPISEAEEEVLRMWHNEDPVSQREIELNQRVYEIQNIRNPYIDYPELVNMIDNF
jgi:hypothetical protein